MAIRALTLASVLLLTAAPVHADQIDCEGVFNQNTTLADIEAAFGKENVVTGLIPGAEGIEYVGTTIFPDDEARKMEVQWWDEENVSRFAGVTLAATDSGPFGVKPGMSIAELQAINGEPFGLFGFYWDYGGGAFFESGKLSDIPGGCSMRVRMEPTRENLPEALLNKISGDMELRSDMPELAEAEVKVWQVSLGYPFPEELEGEMAE